MEIKKYLTDINRTKTDNRKIKYIVIHYTGNSNDTALSNCKYFKTMDRGSSAHYFVDEDNIYQCVKDEDVAWSVGRDYSNGKAPYWTRCTNYNSINIEMCNSKSWNDKVINNTIQLIKILMEVYNIPKENIIRHYDVCGKMCPLPLIDDTAWKTFIAKLDTNREIVRKKYDFAEETLQYLDKYKYTNSLYEKLAQK